jgi:hypothetical protein
MTSRLWAVNCVDKELEAFVPGLFMAWAEPGQSEPTYLGSYIVPKTFDTIFMFKERDDKDWLATFTISISDLGTPSLDSVTIRNGVDRWKIKLIEQYRYTLLELALKIVVKTRTPHIMLESEYSLSAVSLARAMAKLGVGNTDPVLMELPTHLKSVPTKFVRYWDGKADPLTVGELKELAKTVNTTLRKRITPEYLKHIASIYTQAVKDGRKPIHAIMDSERVEHRTASDYASKARKLGLLPETKPGVVTIDKPTSRKVINDKQ